MVKFTEIQDDIEDPSVILSVYDYEYDAYLGNVDLLILVSIGMSMLFCGLLLIRISTTYVRF